MDIGNQSGANTHHHDQSILSISLSIMKTIVNTPKNPIPDDDDELAIVYIF